jgi:hypothetical protein
MNFALRIIAEQNIETNIALGEQFNVLLKQFVSEEKWLDTYRAIFGQSMCTDSDIHEVPVNIHAFVISEGGKGIFLLKDNEYNYIVTDSGKTFKNLTFK